MVLVVLKVDTFPVAHRGRRVAFAHALDTGPVLTVVATFAAVVDVALKVDAIVSASGESLRADADTSVAGLPARALLVAAAAVRRIAGCVCAVLLAQDGGGRTRAATASGAAHLVVRASVATSSTVIRIGVGAYTRRPTQHGTRGAGTDAEAGFAGLSVTAVVTTGAAVLNVARDVHTATWARHQAGRAVVGDLAGRARSVRSTAPRIVGPSTTTGQEYCRCDSDRDT